MKIDNKVIGFNVREGGFEQFMWAAIAACIGQVLIAVYDYQVTATITKPSSPYLDSQDPSTVVLTIGYALYAFAFLVACFGLHAMSVCQAINLKLQVQQNELLQEIAKNTADKNQIDTKGY